MGSDEAQLTAGRVVLRSGGRVSFALQGYYRYGYGPYDLSPAGGFEDLSGSAGARILLGANARTQVVSYSESFPLNGAFTLEGSKTTFVPYLHPVLVPRFSGGDSSVDAALGLGVDLCFSEDLAVRVSGSLGDIEGVGIGLAYIH